MPFKKMTEAQKKARREKKQRERMEIVEAQRAAAAASLSPLDNAKDHLPVSTEEGEFELPARRDGPEEFTVDDSRRMLKDIPGFSVLTMVQRNFLIAYSVLGNITQAAKAALTSKMSHSRWMREDPDIYGAVFREAADIAADYLEAEAARRGQRGVNIKKFNPKTGEEYIEKQYSDTLLIFLLKARRPEIFRDNHNVNVSGKMQNEISGPNGKPIEVKNPDIPWDQMPLELKMQLLEFIDKTEDSHEPKQIEVRVE